MSTLTLTRKQFRTEYTVSEFQADGGRGFQFDKLTNGSDRSADGYAVFCAASGSGEHDSCECRGFLRHGHCKHLTEAKRIAEAATVAKPAMDPAEALDALTALLFGKKPAAPVAAKPARKFADPIANVLFGKPVAGRPSSLTHLDEKDQTSF